MLSTPPLCTLIELQTIYSVDDTLQMHDALDLLDDRTNNNKENQPVVFDGGVKDPWQS